MYMPASIRTSVIFRCAGLLGLSAFAAAVASPQTLPLVQKQDFVWLGAFALPKGSGRQDTFSYGGRAITYNPANDSLFVVGHKKHQKAAEITIPEPVQSKRLFDLNTASFLQDFHDPTEGRLREINPRDSNSQYIGGLLVYKDRLLVNAYSSYDGSGTQSASLFVRSLELDAEQSVAGPMRIGEDAHYTSAYMALVPPEWRDVLGGTVLAGNCCRSIIGFQSQGPSISVLKEDPQPGQRATDASTLLLYRSGDQLGPGPSTKNDLFNLTTRVDGVLFPNRTRSILFFGKHGIGEYCYGEARECRDPAMPYKGTHAYPYVYQVWAYDVGEFTGGGIFGKGKSRKPYAVWTFKLPFEQNDVHEIGGVAYDPDSGRIFISQLNAGKDRTAIIHVFRLATPATPPDTSEEP